MKIYMIYSDEFREYVTTPFKGHDRPVCFSTSEKAIDFLQNTYERGTGELCGKRGNKVTFANITFKHITSSYKIEEVEIE